MCCVMAGLFPLGVTPLMDYIECSTQKGYLFQTRGIEKGWDFMS